MAKAKEKTAQELAQEQSKLEPTYGSFKFIGEVVGIGRDNATNEGTSDKTGRDWKSLRFGVKTSADNTNYVEMMGSENDEFTIKNAKTGEKERLPFDERFDELPEGFYMQGINCTLEFEETGKNNKDGTPKLKGKRVTLQEFDAIDYITENLGDGDSVFVSGRISYSEWKNEESGETQLQKRYQIQFISKQMKDVDFEEEDFEETSMFEQAIVIEGTEKDKQDKTKLHVYGRVIDYKKNWLPVAFTVIEDGQTKKLAAKLRSFKFGTLITVSGQVINSYLETEVAQEKDDWGGAKPTGYRKGTTNTRITEMRITYGDPATLKEKKYTEEDFIKVAAETFGKTEDEDYGKKPTGRKDSDEESEDEVDGDGLPF